MIFLLALILSSCVRQSITWNYVPSHQKISPKARSVSVFIFSDKRKTTTIADYKYLVPLYAKSTSSIYPTVESAFTFSIPHSYLQSVDVAKPKGDCQGTFIGNTYNYFKPVFHLSPAMYQDLKDKNIAQKVDFICDFQPNYDYSISGEILSTDFTQTEYSYYTGFMSPFVLIFGVKNATYKADLKMKYYIFDKNKNIIFEKMYQAKPRSYSTTYYYAPTELMYDEMLKEINREFLEDFSKVI